MNGEFPAPQTQGRKRDLNTVAADPHTGLLARPTQTQGQSLFNQAASYVNNWLGNLTVANKVKDAQSYNKASKVSTEPSGSAKSLVDTQGQGDSPFDTMADWFMEEIGLSVSSVEPASPVAGRPVAPQTTNYQYANKIDKSIDKVATAGGEWLTEQVKGLFNLTYEGPVEPATVPTTPMGKIDRASDSPLGQPGVDNRWLIVILGILYLVTA